MAWKFSNKARFFRSGFEERVKNNLDARGVTYEYESAKFQYTLQSCPHCGGAVTVCTYTADFVFDGRLPFVVEAKGQFTPDDRRKLLLVVREHPDVDIRLLFQRDNVLRKGSTTRYSDWARKHGFKYHVGSTVPEEWCGKPELVEEPRAKKRSARKPKDSGNP